MLKFAGAKLRDRDARYKRQYHVGWKPLLQIRLDAKGMCGIDENAGMLGRYNGLNHGGQVVNVRQRFDA